MKLAIDIFMVGAFLVGVIALLSVGAGLACYMIKDKYFGGEDEDLGSDHKFINSLGSNKSK